MHLQKQGKRKKNILDENKTTAGTSKEEEWFTADSLAHGSSSVGAGVNRVKSCLNYSLKQKYGIEDDEISEKILKVHGLSKKNFEFINNFETLVDSKAAEHSDESEEANADQNSNKSDVSVSGLLVENSLPTSKLIGYRYLYRKMVELYGKQRAKFLCGEMYDYSLALADSSKILLPYCFSINASRLVLEGRPFGKLHSLPPHRVSSYIACLNETVHQICNHTAGAIAIATLFLDCARVMLFEEHETLFKLKHSKKYRKYIKNCLQSFVHSMNHLSRNSTESPFTNVSVFDKPKLEMLLSDDNFGWYFDMEKKPWDFRNGKGADGWRDYCIETISEIQDIFMDIMDAGDVARNGLPITFPVTTCLPPEEKIIINDSIEKVGDVFKDFEYGWTDVEGLYTRDENGNQVAINKVFRGKSDNFVKIKTYGKGGELVVTPDHLCVLEDGTKVKAQELKDGDRLAYVIPNDDVFSKKEIAEMISEQSNYYPEKFGRLNTDVTMMTTCNPIVKKIEFIERPNTDVFNIEVDNEHHTYMLPSGIVTSNCNFSVDNRRDILDNDFLKKICRHDVFRYNIFVSQGSKIASCCFDKDTKVVLDNGNEATLETMYDSGETFISNGITLVPVRLPRNGMPMYKVVMENGEFVATANHKVFMNNEAVFVSDVKPGDALDGLNGKLKVLSSEKLEHYSNDYVYCVEAQNEGHYFYLDNGCKVSNCRLINDEDLFEQGASVNSLGGGASVSLGSHRVCTVNLYRIFLECNGFDDYMARLHDRLESCTDILRAHKELIKDLTKRGLEPFVENGYLDLNRMFSTIGIIGYYEADKHLKEKYGERDYLSEILRAIDDFSREKTMSKSGLIMNVEQIPAESMATRLAKVDSLLFDIPEKIYSNQFVPLYESGHNVWERMDLDGKYGKLLTGGGIVHITLGEKTTSKQSQRLIEYAAKSGCNHFALNPCYSICENGDMVFGKFDVCPDCGGKIVDWITRAIGYFSSVKNWTNAKAKYDFHERDDSVTDVLFEEEKEG